MTKIYQRPFSEVVKFPMGNRINRDSKSWQKKWWAVSRYFYG